MIVKIRQGRKASTLITNFEPFQLTADSLAEELRKLCASATSGKPSSPGSVNLFLMMYLCAVSPVQGKSSGLEVLVQGKQVTAVTGLLVSKGVPSKWIQGKDSGKKK